VAAALRARLQGSNLSCQQLVVQSVNLNYRKVGKPSQPGPHSVSPQAVTNVQCCGMKDGRGMWLQWPTLRLSNNPTSVDPFKHKTRRSTSILLMCCSLCAPRTSCWPSLRDTTTWRPQTHRDRWSGRPSTDMNISTGRSALLMQYSRCCARFLADDRTQCARNQIDWPL
jgi:hypothetical protein